MKKITTFLFLMLPLLNFAQGTCATAVSVTVGTYTNSGVSGTQMPTPDCSGEEDSPFAADWYSYTATSASPVTISADLPENVAEYIDTRLHVYSGACGALSCIGFSDDIDFDNDNYTSVVTFTPVAGQTYHFVWDDYWYFFDTVFNFTVAQAPLSVSEFDAKKVLIYPNPVSNVMTVSGKETINQISVLNLLGQKVLTQNFNSNEAQLNLEILSSGAYMVEVLSGSSRQVMKVIRK